MKDRIFELLPNPTHGVPETAVLLVAVVTKDNDYLEALVPLNNKQPEGLLEAYTQGLQDALRPVFPEVDSITLGRGFLEKLGSNGASLFRADAELVYRCKPEVFSGTGNSPDSAIRKAVALGFEEFLR